MSEKVVIPKEVAKAIEYYRSQGLGSASIASIAVTSAGIGRDRPLVDFVVQAVDNSEIIMSALVNGYEVEKTSEEAIIDYYNGMKCAEEREEQYQRGSGSQFRQGWQSVEETLNLLGIKIEGINA